MRRHGHSHERRNGNLVDAAATRGANEMVGKSEQHEDCQYRYIVRLDPETANLKYERFNRFR